MKQYFNEHPKAQFWSKKNSLLPENVALNSHKKFLFDCPCGQIKFKIYICVKNMNIKILCCQKYKIYCIPPAPISKGGRRKSGLIVLKFQGPTDS